MANNTEFLTFRYSIVKESQLNIYSKPLPEIKGHVIYYAVQQNNADREFKRYGVDYSLIGFHFVQPRSPTEFEENRYLIGKFAKLRQTETGIRVPGDIVSKSQDDWVGSTTVIDTFTQHIFVQKNWKFGKTEQIENALNAGISKAILAEFNCKIFIKAQTKENVFWNLVKESLYLTFRPFFFAVLDLWMSNVLDSVTYSCDSRHKIHNLEVYDDTENRKNRQHPPHLRHAYEDGRCRGCR